MEETDFVVMKRTVSTSRRTSEVRFIRLCNNLVSFRAHLDPSSGRTVRAQVHLFLKVKKPSVVKLLSVPSFHMAVTVILVFISFTLADER